MIVRTSALLRAMVIMLTPILVSSDCQCGYSLNATSDRLHAVYTDILESDFTLIQNITRDTDWVPQAWKVGKEASRGPYGRITELGNVVSNPAKKHNISVEGVNGDAAGLELFVRKLGSDTEHISVAEVDSSRTDMIYGSFRAGIRTSGVNGTCGAFFWYLNDTQEIDMEFLSSQIKATSSPVNLVLHSSLSFGNGGDARDTPTFKVVTLPFATDEGFHEYRFDWEPGKVSFYADGNWLVDMTDPQYVPRTAGKIILSHWSNGNPLWSGGPPEEDAKMTVSYVQAFFNSSRPERQKDHALRCDNPSAANAICQIPHNQGPPTVGSVQFFSQDSTTDRTPNQTISSKDNTKSLAAGVVSGRNWIVLLSAALLSGFLPQII